MTILHNKIRIETLGNPSSIEKLQTLGQSGGFLKVSPGCRRSSGNSIHVDNVFDLSSESRDTPLNVSLGDMPTGSLRLSNADDHMRILWFITHSTNGEEGLF